MRRTLLEILGVSAVMLLLAGTHLDVRSLRESDTRKGAEISRLRTQLSRAKHDERPRIAETVDVQRRELGSMALEIARLTAKLNQIETQLDQSTKFVTKRVTEAIGQGRALSRTVESTQQLVTEQRKLLAVRAAELEQKLREHHELFEGLRCRINRSSPAMTEDMLVPTVQLSGEETVGSGTLVACLARKDKKGWDTYVLTANHVVRNILADEPNLKTEGIHVTIYAPAGKIERKCDVLCRDPQHDLALVKLRGTEKVRWIAQMIDPDRAAKLELWTPIFAVGCPLGNDPIPTGGFLSSLENEVRGTKYWMINAPTYYGNSGGGIFDGESRELIAVFSKIYTHGSTRPIVIPHMGLAVPMSLVYPWLEKQGYGFLVPRGGELATPAK